MKLNLILFPVGTRNKIKDDFTSERMPRQYTPSLCLFGDSTRLRNSCSGKLPKFQRSEERGDGGTRLGEGG